MAAMAHKVRYNEAKLMGTLSDVNSDDSDYLDEPMCPGSDDERYPVTTTIHCMHAQEE